MRDPNRIDDILKELGKVWKEYPDLRFGQLIGNVIANPNRLYFIEDKELTEAIKEYYNNIKKQ